MRYHYFVADVFTDTPLEGNQLAVFDDASQIDGSLMQSTARELRLAETVFVLPPEKGGDARVRIFTPQAELPFAGHPILGTAFVLGTTRDHLSAVRLETGAGTIAVELDRDGAGSCSAGWTSRSQLRGRIRMRTACSQRSASTAPSCRSRPTATVPTTSTSHSKVMKRSPQSGRTCRLFRSSATSEPTASPAQVRDGRPGCSPRASAFPRMRRPARLRGRSRSISLVTAGSRSATRSRYAREPRSSGRL